MELNYQSIRSYWRTAAEKGVLNENPDFAAGANERVPWAAHEFCRKGQLGYFLEHCTSLLQNKDVLDLGCGPGVFSLQIAPLARSILGIDIAPAFVESATKKAEQLGYSHVRFQVGSLVEYQPETFYDFMILGGVLLYVGDSELPRLLERVYQKLRPGGAVYVRTSTAVRKRWIRNGVYPAIYRTPEEYQVHFERVGFLILNQEPDRFYTFADLLSAYFTLLRLFSLNLSRRFSNFETAVFEKILSYRNYLLDAPQAFIQKHKLPVPHLRSYQFVLIKEETIP